MTGVAMDRKMTAAIWVGFLFEGCVFDFTIVSHVWPIALTS